MNAHDIARRMVDVDKMTPGELHEKYGKGQSKHSIQTTMCHMVNSGLLKRLPRTPGTTQRHYSLTPKAKGILAKGETIKLSTWTGTSKGKSAPKAVTAKKPNHNTAFNPNQILTALRALVAQVEVIIKEHEQMKKVAKEISNITNKE